MDRIRFRIDQNIRGDWCLLSRITGECTEFLLATFPDEESALAELEAREYAERKAWEC